MLKEGGLEGLEERKRNNNDNKETDIENYPF